MAQFTLSWNNTDEITNANNTGQRASYRQKSVGGAWITTGFTPANDFGKVVVSAVVTGLLSNNVYEFKIESLCTSNGPIQNDNGVIEQIVFSCLTPSLVNTYNSSVATLNVISTDITKATFTLRKSSDNSIVFGPVTALRSGNTIQATAAGLIASTNYYWQVTLYANINGVEVSSASTNYLNSVCGPTLFTTSVAPVQNLQWIADQTVCETEGGFGVVRTINGLSSPSKTWYDNVNHRMYVADFDDPLGNVSWFNPTTASALSDLTHSAAIHDNLLYNNYIDSQYRRIYFVGANSNGLLVYNVDTDTTSTVAFGSNGSFGRITLAVSPNFIYCNDHTTSIVVINRSTLTVHATIAFGSLASPAHFTLDTQFVYGNNKLYVINVNNTGINTIGVYTPDLVTHLSEITLPGSAIWVGGNNAYWQNAFFDSASGNLYVGDAGSNKRFIINTTTDTVIDTKTITNLGGKSNSVSSWSVNPVTNELIFILTLLNTSGDGSPIRRTYKEDRTSHTYSSMYINQSYVTLAGVDGTNTIVGVDPGNVFWNGNPNYNVDGKIFILSTSQGNLNTGKVIVTTLKQVDANNGNNPTGLTKPNVPSDPDYILPSTNTVTCPITSNLNCPTDVFTSFVGATLNYEFSIVNAVKNNSLINKIQAFAYNANTASVEGAPVEVTAPFTNNYFNGQFVGLGGTNYTIQIRYVDSGNITIKTC